MARALGEAKAQADDIYKHALAASEAEADTARAEAGLVEPLLLSLREAHGAALRVTPEAAAFVAEQMARRSGEPGGQPRALEQLVRAPFESLASSGKIGKRKAWQLVYDEGGLYWLPDDGAA
jgi:hypothetical protein